MILMRIIEVIGTNITPFSDSERISPGSFPNHENKAGKKCIAIPSSITISPMIINHLAMIIYNPHPGFLKTVH